MSAATAWWIRVYRLGFGVLGAVALLWIPLRNIDSATFSLTNYLSYFTVESNILGVAVLLVGGLFAPQSRGWQLVRGAVTLYMLITMVVYAVLLANIDVMLNDKWINDVMHRYLPLVLVLDWALVAMAQRLRPSPALIGQWLIFPLLYGVYTLIRGPIVDWYPYPFIDPRQQGYLSMGIGLVVLTLVFAVLAVAMASLGDLPAWWRERRAAD
ncbi:Pr6Pr family membrane protein [Nocardia mangyaensis]|uniref:Pr6Pr family membrane protein n=1 Tax=Nocardia mangyaensis TaxID=2213200 RepID=UPI00267459A8|nr:Pr6Pr family membrane protein [Nocardia mangyaensis]MDO3649050.1 Pr6Pr family membrane protein [Nocardia mangyaensis]